MRRYTAIKKTKKLLKKNGWVQGQWSATDGTQAMCLLQAIYCATPMGTWGNVSHLNTRHDVVQLLCELEPEMVDGYVTTWNDKTFRTEQDIYDLLNKALRKTRWKLT